MRVRDLGALVVAVGADEQPVIGTRGAAMLALLTINANQRVSADALIAAAWGDQVSAGATSTLDSHIFRLRQLVEPARSRRQAPTVLVSDAGGFRLVAGAASIDSLFFEQCVVDVRDLLAAGHQEAAIQRADRGLALWRGEPYGMFADAEWAQPAVARLHELRTQLHEHRIEALLALGELEIVLSDLPRLITAAPFRELLRGLLMHALYRSGRTEEALEAYRQARQTLIDEVGIEPGPPLQELHQRILRNDPSLLDTSTTRAKEQSGDTQSPSSRGRPVEVHLPSSLGEVIGRAPVIAQLSDLVVERGLVTITGAAGCGKTRVAVEVARSVARHYPDGVWFVDLSTVGDPSLLADVVASTIGFAASAGATPVDDLRGYLRTRRILLVLDNCEHLLPAVAELVQVTLGDPDAALECCLLATSREPIAVDNETVWTLSPLELPDPASGESPTEAPAVELFLHRLRAAAPTLTVDAGVLDRIVDICRAVDGLPLALELAAARVRSYTLHDIAAQVKADPSRLSRIGVVARDHRSTLRSAIDWSHRLLDADQQAAHRRLSVLPGPFTADLGAAVIDAGGATDPDDLLAQLVHRSLLTSDASTEPGRTTSFRQLATVRAHAQHALAEVDETTICADRRDDWTAALLAARPPLGSAAEVGWYRTLDDTYACVRATLARHLIDQPSVFGARLPHRLTFYWYCRERLVEGTRWLRQAYEVLQDGDEDDLLLAQIALASALAVQGRTDLARPHVAAALERLDFIPPHRLVEVGEGLAGLATSAWASGTADLVLEVHGRLGQVAEQARNPALSLLVEAVGCIALFAAGRIDDAVARAVQVDQRAVDADNLMAVWIAAGSPTIAALLTANPAQGIPWVNRLMRTHLRLGTGAGGSFIETRANFAAQSGCHAEAARLYGAAYAETRRAGMVWPRRQLTTQLITVTRGQLSRADYENQWQAGEQLTMAAVVDE